MQKITKALWVLGIASSTALNMASASAAEVAVDQKDLKFVPDAITIRAGDSIRFTDTDRIAQHHHR